MNQLINETEILVNQVMRNLLREPIRVLRESLDIKILKAKDIIRNSGNNEANNLLVEGIENKAIAEQEFKTDEFQKAIKHFRQAQFRVQKSIDIVMNRDKTTATKADNEAQQFDQLFAQLKAIITKSTDPEVQKKL